MDTGCSKSCCSQIWLDEYIETLNEDEKTKVEYFPSQRFFRFGDSRWYESKGGVKIPAKIGGKRFMINADIVEAEIPLLTE